ncbi:hypothetical protein [Georgenia sp. SYP-B2076]|uniref:hypothetical protein n=1 Tax=Georgenia sp. SYP-B2076 TaxID=2495881 RepID=UPI000F8F72C3|nr:hypothetical protein [Georgenia sp. SYP-B2076]
MTQDTLFSNGCVGSVPTSSPAGLADVPPGHLQPARTFAREFFAALKSNSSIQAELTAAIQECFRRYDTGPFENRFIVGAVVEQILGATARSLGFDVENSGARRQAYDLELSPGYGISIKYTSSVGRSARVRLTNSQGAVGEWNTGTIFVLAGIGIGYADVYLTPGATIPAGDEKSLDVALRPLLHFWGVEPIKSKAPEPEWLAVVPNTEPRMGYFLPIAVPARATVRSPRLAGDPIALDILQSGRSQTLLAHFKWSI